MTQAKKFAGWEGGSGTTHFSPKRNRAPPLRFTRILFSKDQWTHIWTSWEGGKRRNTLLTKAELSAPPLSFISITFQKINELTLEQVGKGAGGRNTLLTKANRARPRRASSAFSFQDIIQV